MTGRHVAAVALLAAAGGFAAVEVGAWASVQSSLSEAQQLRDRGDWAGAYGVDTALAQRSGALYLLAARQTSGIDAQIATDAAQWATALAAAHRPDDAVTLLEGLPASVQSPALEHERAQLLLASAAEDERAGRPDVAVARLDALLATPLPPDIAAQARAARAVDEVAQARRLLDLQRPAEAVALLDQARDDAPAGSPAVAVSGQELPVALFAAAQADLAAQDWGDAAAALSRLVSGFPDAPDAAAARRQLAGPQTVSGTVVLRDGTPVVAHIRLSSHFVKLSGGYRTSAPFFEGTTDSHGDFTLDGVPVGGGYVLEVLEDQGWTTLVNGDRPAQPVTVAPVTPADMSFVVLPG